MLAFSACADSQSPDESPAADRYRVTGRQERVDEEEATASVRINLAARERLIRPLAVVK